MRIKTHFMKINKIAYGLGAIVFIIALFFIIKPKTQNQTRNPSAQQSPAISQASPQSNDKTFELIIENKKLISGPSTIKVEKGDQVLIKITADEAEEFHIHGIDYFVDLEPEVQKELSFSANTTGRFVFELERSGTDLGALEVSPKQ